MTGQEKSIGSREAKAKDIQEKVRLAAEIFEKYGDDIRAMIHFNTKDRSKADDIFQNFFVSIVRKPIPQDIQNIRAYLFKAVTNDVIDVSRRNKCRNDHMENYALCRKHYFKTDDPQKTAIRIEDAKKMFKQIHTLLSEREAEIVIHRYGRGFNTTDTAETLQVDNRNVSRRLSMALRKIRDFIPENVDDKI